MWEKKCYHRGEEALGESGAHDRGLEKIWEMRWKANKCLGDNSTDQQNEARLRKYWRRKTEKTKKVLEEAREN